MKDFRSCCQGLIRHLRPIGWKIAVACLLGLAEVALSLLFVWASKQTVDIATGQLAGSISRAAVIMAAVMAAQIAVRVSARYWKGRITVKAANAARASAFEKVMRSTWNGQEKYHTADTANRLSEDLRVTVDFLCETLPDIVTTLMQLTAASVYLFTMEPGLTWILLIIMPAAVLASRLFFRTMRRLSTEIREGEAAIQTHLMENILQRMLIKMLGGTQRAQERMHTLQENVLQKTLRRLDYRAVAGTFLQIGFATGYAAAFFWGAFGISRHTVTYGMMVAFLQLVGQIQRPVAQLANYIPALIQALSAEERLMEIEELPQEREAAPILLEGAPGIRLEALSFGYEGQEQKIFERLCFDFRPGRMTAIVGPTGAGKSSLVKVMMAMLEKSGGKAVLYDGRREAESSPETRCNFMYVPQGNSLMSGTLRQNLLMAKPEATDAELCEALHLAVADFVDDLPAGLETACSDIGRGLSEGQAQRIAIARALLRPGGILILDEATSALDAETESELLRRLSERYKGHKTIICITHRPAALSLADAVLRLS